MTRARPFALFWIGLVAFAIVVALSLPLTIPAVPGGLVDHQGAATAAEVDRIQQAWRAAGLEAQARVAMAADLVFIGLFGIGSIVAGTHLRRSVPRVTRALGALAMIAGAMFLVTDYAETVSQLIQLYRFTGDDTLAGLAAAVRPIKVAAWFACALAVPGGWLWGRFSTSGA